MASEEQAAIRIKQERKEATSIVKPLQPPAPPPPVARTTISGPGQQKITQYFGGSKNNTPPPPPSESDDDRKTPPLDIDSVKGVFGWTSFGSVHIPYILRKGERYAAVRMIEGKLLKKFLQALPPDVYSCTYIKSYFITECEAKLLNEINSHHCVYQFGYDLFTPKDLVVPLEDARNFYEFLETCYVKLVNPTAQESDISRCGFIKLNGTVVPYVKRDGTKYVPLSFFEQELEELKMKAEKLESWELSYLKFCCKLAGLNSDLLTNQSCPIVSLDTVKQCTVGRMCLEDWWPSHNRTMNFSSASALHRPNSISKNSIFQAPDASSPNSLFEGAMRISNGKNETSKLNSAASEKHSTASLSSVLAAAEKVVTPSQPSAIPMYQTSDVLPTLASVPWGAAPQPLLFNAQWWKPIGANTDTYLPAVLSGPNLTFEKFLQHIQSTSSLQSKQVDHNILQSPLQRSDTSNTATAKTSTGIVPHTDDYCNQSSSRPPPPLLRIGETSLNPSTVNGLRLPPTSTAAMYLPQQGRTNYVLASSAREATRNSSLSLLKTSQAGSKSNSDSLVLNSGVSKTNSANLRIAPASQWSHFSDTRSASALLGGRPVSSHTENLVVAPGVHQSMKQTSPKPANPVPSVSSGLYFARPPPPLIPSNGTVTTSMSPTLVTSATHQLSLLSQTALQNPYPLQPIPMLSKSAQSSDKRVPAGYVGERPAYKLQQKQIDGKELPVINLKPYVYNGAQLASLHDVVTTFFPNMTITGCQHVLSEVLGVALFESNSLQQAALANPPTSTLMQVDDLINFMPQLKYMFARVDCHGETVVASHLTHTPKRIRL